MKTPRAISGRYHRDQKAESAVPRLTVGTSSANAHKVHLHRSNDVPLRCQAMPTAAMVSPLVINIPLANFIMSLPKENCRFDTGILLSRRVALFDCNPYHGRHDETGSRITVDCPNTVEIQDNSCCGSMRYAELTDDIDRVIHKFKLVGM